MIVLFELSFHALIENGNPPHLGNKNFIAKNSNTNTRSKGQACSSIFCINHFSLNFTSIMVAHVKLIPRSLSEVPIGFLVMYTLYEISTSFLLRDIKEVIAHVCKN
ncbi:hypothetical protein GW864_01500 [bacterium]|nr:hypothetical protein [bacterium]